MDNKKQPEILWHYTDMAGFQQIMTPGAWLYGTHYRFFSDPQEGVYFEDLPPYSTFVTCFTEQGDQKKLWEMWENKTFCIGFSYEALLEAAQYIFYSECLKNKANEMNNALFALNDIRLYKVIYSDTPEESYKEFIKKKKEETNIDEDILRKNYFLRFKKANFSKECEWRIIRNYDRIPQNQIEWIADKPRLPLFPIIHAHMIKHIIYKPKNFANSMIYEKFAKMSCKNLGININPIAQTKFFFNNRIA